MSSSGRSPQTGTASPARSARRRGRHRSARGAGTARPAGRPGLNSSSTSSPQTLPNDDASDEVLDVDTAVAQRAAVLVRFGDLCLEGDDALETGYEVRVRHGGHSSTRGDLGSAGSLLTCYLTRPPAVRPRVPGPERASQNGPMDPTALAALRRSYELAGLDVADVDPDPVAQFLRWLADAVAAELIEPNAMVLATADASGRPRARTLLLKVADADGLHLLHQLRLDQGSAPGREPAGVDVLPLARARAAGDGDRAGRAGQPGRDGRVLPLPAARQPARRAGPRGRAR